MNVRIIIDANLTGITKPVLEDCEAELIETLDAELSQGYFLTHPDTDREYEAEISVTKVVIER